MATSAQAGSYAVSYSGGTATFTIPGTSISGPRPYSLGSDGFYGGGAGAMWGDWGPNGSVIDGTGKCEGAITATFTWKPSSNVTDDPPPSSVVISEEGNALVNSRGDSASSVATTAICSNGMVKESPDMGEEFPFVPRQGYPNTINGTSKGIRYKIKEQPGLSFTLTCSPSLTVTGKGVVGPPISGGDGGGSVEYKATATPLEIVLSGGIGARNQKKFLIGQQVTGTVSTGGLPASGFNWTVSGNPFKNYQFAWASPSDPTSSVLVPFGTQTQPSVTFYYSQPSSQSAVATSVHLAVPAGALPTAGLNASLSRTCTVQAPTWTIGTTTGTTRLEPISAPNGMIFDGGFYIYPDGRITKAGIIWYGTVTTPAGYPSGGGWNVTQLMKPHRVRSEDGTVQGLASNDVLALDTTFGYDPVYPSLYPDTTTQTGSDDSPSNGFDGPEPLYGPAIPGTESLTVDDSFTDYVMYKPPGTGSCFVPLENFTWFWKGQVLPDTSGGWLLFNPGGSSAPGSHFPAHPIWSSNAGQGLNWVP